MISEIPNYHQLSESNEAISANILTTIDNVITVRWVRLKKGLKTSMAVGLLTVVRIGGTTINAVSAVPKIAPMHNRTSNMVTSYLSYPWF